MNGKDLGVSPAVFARWAASELPVSRMDDLNRRAMLYVSGRTNCNQGPAIRRVAEVRGVKLYELALYLGVNISTLKLWLRGGFVPRHTRFLLEQLASNDVVWNSLKELAESESVGIKK